jgi:hypothetical protein
MSFVNEYISPEDVEKYQLKAIDDRTHIGRTKARDWTIDRQRNIYLRNIAIGGGADPDIRNRTEWTFYWHDEPLTLRLDLLEGSGGRGEPGWSHWLLVRVNGSYGLPSSLKTHKVQFLADLKDALVTYKDFGVYSTNTDYSVTLDIADECVL